MSAITGSPDLQHARAGDVDGAADVGRARARQEVADELDRPSRGDLCRRLRRGEQLDLARAGHRAVGDRLLAEPAELIAGVDLLELVPVLDQPDPVERRSRVDDGSGHRRAQPGIGAGNLGGDTDTARPRDRRDGGQHLDESGDRVEVDAEPALAEPEHRVRVRQLLRDRRLVQHDDERPLAVTADDERRGTAEVPPVAAEMVDVVDTEDDGAVDLLVVHPAAKSLDSVRRPGRRDGQVASSSTGGMVGGRVCHTRPPLPCRRPIRHLESGGRTDEWSASVLLDFDWARGTIGWLHIQAARREFSGGCARRAGRDRHWVGDGTRPGYRPGARRGGRVRGGARDRRRLGARRRRRARRRAVSSRVPIRPTWRRARRSTSRSPPSCGTSAGSTSSSTTRASVASAHTRRMSPTRTGTTRSP